VAAEIEGFKGDNRVRGTREQRMLMQVVLVMLRLGAGIT